MENTNLSAFKRALKEQDDVAKAAAAKILERVSPSRNGVQIKGLTLTSGSPTPKESSELVQQPVGSMMVAAKYNSPTNAGVWKNSFVV